MYEGALDGSKVCVKRVRVYANDGVAKATKVRYPTVFPSPVTYESRRPSTTRL